MPPEANTFQSCPPSVSCHVVKAIQFPSGDHAGAYSKPFSSEKPSAVRARGSPSGNDCSQMRPMAWNANVWPFGAADGQRRKRAMKGSSVMRKLARLCSDAVRCTRAWKGIVDTFPLSMSRRLILPP